MEGVDGDDDVICKYVNRLQTINLIRDFINTFEDKKSIKYLVVCVYHIIRVKIIVFLY